VKIFPSFIVGNALRFFCLYKVVFIYMAALFFYYDVFVTIPYDHVKMFLGDALRFFCLYKEWVHGALYFFLLCVCDYTI
jgi:hypothetical protein